MESKKQLFSEWSNLYKTPTFPGAFKGLQVFFHHLKKKYPSIKFKDVQEWKKYDSNYTKNKPTRRKFLRKSYKIFSPNRIWEADLLDMSTYAKTNKGVHFILMVIDQFTKKLFVYPCKTKSKQDVLKGFKNIFEYQTMSRPANLYTDNGTEFKNSLVTNYLKELNIHHFTSKDKDVKAAIAERVNRTIKQTLVMIARTHNNKYLNYLDDVVKNYNNTPNRVTKYAPNNIDVLNVNKARINIASFSENKKQLYAKQKNTWDKNLHKPRLAIGDWVHIVKEKKTFRRGYDQQFTDELFQITDVNNNEQPITYKLSDLAREPVTSYFTYPELSQTIFPTYFNIAEQQQQFTDPTNNTKYTKVKIKEYWNYIWIANSVLTDRSAKEKRNKQISSSVFMHWLNS